MIPAKILVTKILISEPRASGDDPEAMKAQGKRPQ